VLLIDTSHGTPVVLRAFPTRRSSDLRPPPARVAPAAAAWQAAVAPASGAEPPAGARPAPPGPVPAPRQRATTGCRSTATGSSHRSEEHTSELQSQSNLVCRLLLEKKK